MTDTPSPAAAEPAPNPYPELLSAIQKAFNTGVTASPEQAAGIRAAVDKLLDTGRGSTLDFSDPANSALAGAH